MSLLLSIYLFSIVLIMLLIGGILSKLAELQADRIALDFTRNYSAAESALTNMVKHSQIPEFHEMDLSSHPRVSKRLRILRQIADEKCYSMVVSDLNTGE
jgi:Zn-dependent protease with chaperone function